MIDWEEQVQCFNTFIAERRSHGPFGLLPGIDVNFAELMRVLSDYSYPLDILALIRISNGQEVKSVPVIRDEFWLLDLNESLSHAEIGEENVYECEYGEPRVRDISWSHGWFPFAMDGFGECLIIDMDPGPKGVIGQIVKVWHDDNRVEVIANTLCELLERYGRRVGEGWEP